MSNFIKNIKIGNSDKSMTAVELLQMKMATSSPQEMVENINVWFSEAKQMEKEQIMKAHKEGNKYNGWALEHEHEQYYNETFGNH